jgi:hypothetical protein
VYVQLLDDITSRTSQQIELRIIWCVCTHIIYHPSIYLNLYWNPQLHPRNTSSFNNFLNTSLLHLSILHSLIAQHSMCLYMYEKQIYFLDYSDCRCLVSILLASSQNMDWYVLSFHFFVHGCWVILTPIVFNNYLHCLTIFAKNQLNVFLWFCFLGSLFGPLIYVPILLPINTHFELL